MSNSEHPQSFSQTDSRFWLGILFVIIGGTWLLDNLNVIPYYIEDWFFNWETFLILLGVYFIFGRKKPEAGIIMIAIGGVFLLDEFNFFHWRDIIQVFWPVVFIIIGVSLMLRRSYTIKKKSEQDSDIDYIDDFAFFGGRERTVDSASFKGGKVTAMFGGSEIDLRNAELAEGTSELDLFVMFGGTHIIIPPDWAVKIEVFSILGGFGDKRSSTLKVVPQPGKTLIIKGFVMFGGGEVKLTK
ncbi:MAG: LiaI-LiaF-like domain-containing protein [Candidatus Cyclobacteriaceae bacterium M2_1C_046]